MNVQDLENRAAQIRDEKNVGANTAERVGGLMYDMIGFSVKNRQHLNGDSTVTDANKYPFIAIYIDNPASEYNDLNAKLNDIALMATPKYNGNLRFYLSGVRIDVINRVLNYGNKTTSQMVFGPLQPTMAGALEYNGKEDQIVRRQYKNGGWSQWEVIRPAEVGFRSSGSFSERFNDPTNLASGTWAHAEGTKTQATREAAHAEGCECLAQGDFSHAEGFKNTVKSRGSHAEGGKNTINCEDAEGWRSCYSHVEGYNNVVGPKANQSHTEGENNRNEALDAHCEGYGNHITVTAKYTHVEGYNNKVEACYVHCEGSDNVVGADAHFSHIEGTWNKVHGYNCRVSGDSNLVQSVRANVYGLGNTVKSTASDSFIFGRANTVTNSFETALGMFNRSTSNKTFFSIGQGNNQNAKNAFEIDNQGQVYIQGINGYDGTNVDATRSVQAYLDEPRGEFIYINNILTEFSAAVDVTQYVVISIEDAMGTKYITEKALRAGIFGVYLSPEGQDNSSIPLSCSLINEVASDVSRYEFMFLLRGVIYQFEMTLKPDGKWFTVPDSLIQRKVENIPSAPIIEFLDLTGYIVSIGGSDWDISGQTPWLDKNNIKRSVLMGYYSRNIEDTARSIMPLNIDVDNAPDGSYYMTITARCINDIITLKFHVSADGRTKKYLAKESSKTLG